MHSRHHYAVPQRKSTNQNAKRRAQRRPYATRPVVFDSKSENIARRCHYQAKPDEAAPPNPSAFPRYQIERRSGSRSIRRSIDWRHEQAEHQRDSAEQLQRHHQDICLRKPFFEGRKRSRLTVRLNQRHEKNYPARHRRQHEQCGKPKRAPQGNRLHACQKQPGIQSDGHADQSARRMKRTRNKHGMAIRFRLPKQHQCEAEPNPDNDEPRPRR